jgi:NADH:ubiquinone reductase (H+-translocating)
VRVVGVGPEGVRIVTPQGEEQIRARTVLWAAGVSASEFAGTLAAATGAPTDRGGRILVDEHCRIPGHPEIFVIGDVASVANRDGTPVPGVAPAAMQQGRYVAAVIQGRQQGPFRYRDKGSLAVIGRASAVAQFPLLKAHGLIAWLLWLFIHLMYLVGFQNRLVVFIRWAFNYFTYNRGARLITGEEPRALS